MGSPTRKIAVVSLSLARGGAERFAATHSRLLTDSGYEVHHILIEDDIAYPYAGTIYNLGDLCKNDFAWWRKIKKGILLRRYLMEHQIDTVLDNRTRPLALREWFTRRIYGRRKIIYMVHSARIDNYLPPRWMSKFVLRGVTLVCVSKAIAQKVRAVYCVEDVHAIYNPIPALAPDSPRVNLPSPFILFFGRLDEKVKNFTLLLEGFAMSKLAGSGYRLVILGDGPDAAYILETAVRLGIENQVILLPFEPNPYAYVQNARFTVLTSRYEGFPMSVIESLALGTPVVSVDCDSGPAEVILNKQNGLLIPNHNVAALAGAMAALAQDNDLYDICRQGAAPSVAHLSSDHIARQWQQILTL